jgi:hypothetical protein
MGGVRGRDKEDPVQIQAFLELIGEEEVAQMDGVE